MTGPAPTVELERIDRTLVVRLNRPQALNAFEDQMLIELALAFRAAASDEDVQAVVLTGAGRGFCSGADLRVGFDKPTVSLGIRRRLNPVILAMAALDKPLIGAINGTVAGAGLGFIGVCDTRISSAAAMFVPAVIKIGVIPDGGVSYFLPRLMGPGRAFTWLATGTHITAQQAQDWGLVDEVVEPDDLMPRALALAEIFADQPAAALRLAKRLIRQTPMTSLAEQLDREQQYQDEGARDVLHNARVRPAHSFTKN